MAQLASTWTAPNNGATVGELLKALRHRDGHPTTRDVKRARTRLAVLSVLRSRDYRTNLRVKGARLQPYDVLRIAEVR